MNTIKLFFNPRIAGAAALAACCLASSVVVAVAQTAGLPNDLVFRQVAAGWYHTVALKGDGTLWAWGYNYYGQLGDGTATNKSSPLQVGTATNWQAVAAGYSHTLE